jgi:hypothetical protein
MSRYPRSPQRRLGAALLQACSALSLLACAHAVDNSAADSADSAWDATAGATGSAASGAGGGSASAGLGNASGSGDIASQAQGGAASDDAGAGAPGSAGQVAFAGAGGATAGASSAGGAHNSAGAGNTGHGGNSTGGASVGSSGSHLCKVTTDLNVYTPSNTGCGGYAACKGQIHWRNDEAQTLTKLVLSFSEPAGTTCIDDNATSKWTITDNGATSHRCVFTASGTLTVDSKSALSFGYDTNQTGSTAPSEISVADPSCN